MDKINQNSEFLYELINAFKDVFALEETLEIDATNFKAFDVSKLPGSNLAGIPEVVFNSLKDQSKKYGLIFESFPVGMKMVDSVTNYKLPVEYIWILDTLPYVNENGFLLAVLPPSVLFSQKGKEFEQVLNKSGYSFSAVLNLPNPFYKSVTAVQFIILVIKKGSSDKLFIADTDYSSNLNSMLLNYINKSSASLEDGVFIDRVEFTSFENYRVNQQISKLQTQYKSYKQYPLEEIALEVNSTKDTFEDIENAIYIPRIGTSFPVSNLQEATLKHQNYFQVILKKEIVVSKYLEIFFKSKLGLMTLDTLKKSTFIPHVNKSDLIGINIPIPDPETQNLIIITNGKIKQLEEKISDFDSQLSLNPNSAQEIQGVLNSVLQSLGKLNEEDQILELVRQGESKNLEFKQSFSKDVDTGIKEKEKSIRESSLKNIVGFLNSEGGTLLIGVKDSGEIYGVENDYYENDDKYLLNFKSNVKDHIGEDAYPFLDWKLVSVGDKRILRVDCKTSTSEPFFLNESDFYVRTNPSVDKLVGPKLANYLKERFNK